MTVELTKALVDLENKKDLSESQMSEVMNLLMRGQLLDPDIGKFLSLLAQKNESTTEITQAARVLRDYMIRVPKPNTAELVDTCGTGGDNSHGVNVSTIAALLLSGMGVAVAKHGNRSVSSLCGSADLLEYLGVNIHHDSASAVRQIESINFAFLFAPDFHPAVKNAKAARQSLGRKTIFNILGPLCNPAPTTHQLIGVYSLDLLPKLRDVCLNLKIPNVLLVCSEQGKDEIDIVGRTKMILIQDGVAQDIYFDAKDLGESNSASTSFLQDKTQVLSKARDIIDGTCRDSDSKMVALNAGATLFLAQRAKTIAQGYQEAAEALWAGIARQQLEKILCYQRAS